ncbi:hypothetical protein ACFZA9_35750 [Streptomyces olivaceus]|uniref:hypothetical protein n=1 Tax=Streptomyces olivaceus TaxID=47716 RepID=UPI0036E5FFD2
MSYLAADPCDGIKGPAKAYCERGDGGALPDGGAPGHGSQGPAEGAVRLLHDLIESLIRALRRLLAPDTLFAPEMSDKMSDTWLYQQFLWLGQHLAVAVFVCVVVVCALTAWQGAHRFRQLGASTGWTLAAVAGMAAVPGVVMVLNEAVSAAFTAAFNSNEGTLFGAITEDLKTSADAKNPLALLLLFAVLAVALAFAALVFMTRSIGILVFVCMAPVVLASLARGGDTTAVKAWAQRLLGLMFAPFALLLLSPFVQLAQGSLAMDAVLLVAADALMLRMIFHGVPYFGPRVAGAARAMVERRTEHPLARAVVRAGAPAVYEQESTPRVPRTVDTPRRAMSQDRGVLFGAYGINRQERPGRLTTGSAIAKVTRDTERTAQISQARRQAREATRSAGPAAPPQRPAAPPPPAQSPQPAPNRPTSP